MGRPSVGEWPRLGLIGLVRGYRLFFKAWLGNVCRFEPSCSAYALGALQQHGAAAGSLPGGAPHLALPSLVCGWL